MIEKTLENHIKHNPIIHEPTSLGIHKPSEYGFTS